MARQDDLRRGDGAGRWRPGDPLPEPVTAGRGRTEVRLDLSPVGRDLLLLVTGGEAHVGAAAVAGIGPGGDSEIHAAILPPHKEGPLARECAALLSEAAGCTVCVVAGIHQDGATRGEIAAIVANVREAADRLARALSGP